MLTGETCLQSCAKLLNREGQETIPDECKGVGWRLIPFEVHRLSRGKMEEIWED